MTWTRITDPEDAETLLPSWLGRRLVGLHGRFGLLLTTGDVLRITSIAAVNLSSEGLVLLDVSLDDAGVPDGIDLAWRPKQFLGAPVPGATSATVNLAQVVTAVEFLAPVTVVLAGDADTPTADEVVIELGRVAEAAAHGDSASAVTAPEGVSGALASTEGPAPPIVMIELPDAIVPEETTRKRKKGKK